MKAIKALVVVFIPFLLDAQASVSDKGIQFERSLSWRQILEKAKAENKYIFADFYATWCGPCKVMDLDVYANKLVGDIANHDFIAVRIQVDKTAMDYADTKSWYVDSDSLSHLYHVNALPTLMFFSSSGMLISKEEGYKSTTDFVHLLNYTMTVKQGYGALVALYKKGELPRSEMGKLAMDAKEIGDRGLADSIARTYKNEYLDKLSDSVLLAKENVRFVANFPSLINEKDRMFDFFYRYGAQVDEWSNARKGYAKDVIKSIIVDAEINRKIYKEGKVVIAEPDWGELYQNISRKYSATYADDIIPPAKREFYVATKNWKAYAADFERRIKHYPPQSGGRFLGGMIDDVWELNSTAWYLFLHCGDRKVLKKALQWSELSIHLASEHKDDVTQYLDTKANLLYKLGRADKAIPLERQVVELTKNMASYRVVLAKMKEGSPTWPINN
jgi:thioredoxin-related protein